MTAPTENAPDSNSKLEGSWVKIFKTGDYGPDAKFDRDDLDEIVRNHAADGQKPPVGVELDWSGAQRHGQVSEVRRDGRHLEGKLSNIDPRLEELHHAGAFKRMAVTLHRTPQGLRLARVGFVKDGSNSMLDLVHKGHFNKQEVVFREEPYLGGYITFTNDLADSAAEREIARLKAARRWSRRFDRYGMGKVLSTLENSNLRVEFSEAGVRHLRSPVEIMAEFLGYISPFVRFAEGESARVALSDVSLSSEAHRIKGERGISYSEALDLAHKEQSLRQRETFYFGSTVRP